MTFRSFVRKLLRHAAILFLEGCGESGSSVSTQKTETGPSLPAGLLPAPTVSAPPRPDKIRYFASLPSNLDLPEIRALAERSIIREHELGLMSHQEAHFWLTLASNPTDLIRDLFIH